MLATCILNEVLQTPGISVFVGQSLSLLALACLISSLVEFTLFTSKFGPDPLSRIKKEGTPTEVCFDIFGPTTPSFSLKDFLLAELHCWNRDLRIKGLDHPMLNCNGRLSV